MNKIAFTTLILSLSASASFAQAPQYTGGMKYTTMRAAEPSDDEKKPIYNRKQETEEEARNTEDAPSDEAPEKTPEQSAWDKYKELASGKGKGSDTKDGSALPKAPDKPIAPKQATEKEKATKPGGFASIIENYQQNKAKRSQIRSISYEVPEDLKVNKPGIDAPTVDTPEVEKPKIDKQP